MTEGIVRIYMSIKEPEDKNILWMRPCLTKEGYKILFYGSKGWTDLHEIKDEDIIIPPIEDNPQEDTTCGC